MDSNKDTYIRELWKEPEHGLEVEINYSESSRYLSSLSCNWDVPKGYEFPHKADNPEDLVALGWVKIKELEREEITHIPFLTVQSVFEALAEMAPELVNHKLEAQAMLKRHIHVEKLSVYQRLQHYTNYIEDSFLKELLKGKVETHTEYALKPDREIITWEV